MLADRFRFSLLTFQSKSFGVAEVAEDLRREHLELRPIFENVHWIARPDGLAPASIEGLDLPEDARRFYSAAMAQKLRSLVDAGEADLVHVEFDLMAAYGRCFSGAAKVLTQHDMGGASFFGSYFREMSGWGKLARVPEWRRRVRFAKATGADYDRVVVTTEPDRRALLGMSPRATVAAVATGVDLEFFQRREPPRPGVRLVFVGHYPHFPNEDAALHLLRDIFPRVRRLEPQAELVLAGSDPTDVLKAAAANISGVRVTGTVPDVRPYLSDATVFVAPVRLGRGIKGKILEAFAMGVPVVASSRAASGLDAAAGRDLLVADGAARFADAVVRLIRSEPLRLGVGENGRRVAQRSYDWRTLAARLGDLYDDLLRPPTGPRAA
ncbi:MAG: glycosyltransferase [Elusimicrobia bacterium]|nr:glycosyltransferase [Elusimicrobiota bacterium]